MKKAVQIPYNDLFEKKCEYAKAAGFEYISVNFYEMMGKTDKQWEEATEHVLSVLTENCIECVQTHPYYYDLRISSEVIDEDCEFAIKQAIVASGKIGAKWCALHPRTSISSGYSVSKSFEDNRKSFSEYLELAKKNNTGIAVENLPIFQGLIPTMPFYSANYEDLCELTDSFKDRSLAVCWDTGHANLMHFNQANAIRYMGSRIQCTHIHNNHQKEDSHFPPDNGNIDWNSVMEAFVSFGYDGPLTLEIHSPYTTEDFLRNFISHNYGCLEILEKIAKECTK